MITGFEDVRKARPIAENINDAKRLAPYIEEAETLWLKPIIGAKLYREIEADKPSFSDLINGVLYDNDTKDFPGLGITMGYLSFSRFVRNQNVNITAFGVVIKRGDLSEPAEDKTIVRIANDAEKIGLEYLDQCIEYMRYKGYINRCNTVRRIRKFKPIG